MSVWFVIPAHGRPQVTDVALRLLADTCETLCFAGLEATAVVATDDPVILETAADLGFATVVQENDPVGRKLNDAYQLATDPEFNPRPAEYVIPFGTDNWIDPDLLLTAPLPDAGSITVFREGAVVNEEGNRVAMVRANVGAGLGIRVIPTGLVAMCGYRPCAEDMSISLDTHTLQTIKERTRRLPRLVTHDLHPLQIVDWKTTAANLHSYEWYVKFNRGEEHPDPYRVLAPVYPGWALDAMRAAYREPVVAA